MEESEPVKNCLMCGTDREDVAAVQVTPAAWNGFNDFAEVCATCQESRRFKMWSRARKPRTTAASTAAAEVAAASAKVEIQIAHKRTGALLHIVASPTLAQASLSGAPLSGADLQHAAMRGADLHRADLHLADLAGADLRGADLRAVNLRGADLRGTDLTDARLNRADLNHALYDSWTRWPSDFDPSTSGARREARSG